MNYHKISQTDDGDGDGDVYAEVDLKSRGVEEDVGRLGDVRSMHAVVVRNILVMVSIMVM